MKLPTKRIIRNILAGSLILAIIFERFAFNFTKLKHPADGPAFYWTAGFPINYYNTISEFGNYTLNGFLLNLSFWFLVAIIIIGALTYLFTPKKLII